MTNVGMLLEHNGMFLLNEELTHTHIHKQSKPWHTTSDHRGIKGSTVMPLLVYPGVTFKNVSADRQKATRCVYTKTCINSEWERRKKVEKYFFPLCFSISSTSCQLLFIMLCTTSKDILFNSFKIVCTAGENTVLYCCSVMFYPLWLLWE